MSESDPRRLFIKELWERFEVLQQWAIEHWPDQQHPLSSADFVETRKELLGLRNPAQAPGGTGPGAASGQGREPADGGAQYEDVAPAPWP